VVAGDQSDPVDVLILGGGPAGYVCALRAAQNGRQVTLVERSRVGGVCLTEGCIPSKHLAIFAAAKALKYWAIATLGSRWTFRVLVPPQSTRTKSGPYRWVSHPNYIAVALEMLFVPLAHGAFLCAAIFSALDAALLRQRIRDEERALGGAWEQAFAGVPRFIPHG